MITTVGISPEFNQRATVCLLRFRPLNLTSSSTISCRYSRSSSFLSFVSFSITLLSENKTEHRKPPMFCLLLSLPGFILCFLNYTQCNTVEPYLASCFYESHFLSLCYYPSSSIIFSKKSNNLTVRALCFRNQCVSMVQRGVVSGLFLRL